MKAINYYLSLLKAVASCFEDNIVIERLLKAC